MSDESATTDSFLRTLAAACTHPGLRSVLLLDADAEQMDLVSRCLSRFLDTFVAAAVETVELTAHHHDEHLWDGDPFFGHDVGRRALLVQPEGNPGFRLVRIRDLSTLSVESARACVQLMDSPVARLERHGVRREWRPRLLWLAACSRESVGQVSAHLLDRFALRPRVSTIAGDRRQRLRNVLLPSPESARLEKDAFDRQIVQVTRQVSLLRRRLRAGRSEGDAVLPAALTEALDTWIDPEIAGVRRQLALARLALALAALEDVQLEFRHVSEAAFSLGLVRRVTSHSPGVTSPSSSEPSGAPDSQLLASKPLTAAEIHGRLALIDSTHGVEEMPNLLTADSRHVLPSAALSGRPEGEDAGVAPRAAGFPEDDAPVAREHAGLRPSRRRSTHRAHGPPIGSRRTDRPEEVAIVPTLLAAAPYQSLRRARLPSATEKWIIHRDDWRAFRRAPLIEDLLVLVLDMTCSEDSLEELVPYLRQAYVDRAAVRVILIGTRDAKNELRAEVVSARGVLAQELKAALDREAGRATPLAHGLSLASRLAREHCFRGRGPGHHAEVVVMTDGLGNVPLEASRAGRVLGRVTREGIDDALRMAHELRAIRTAHVIAIPPKRLRSVQAFQALVEALGADLPPQS